MLVGIPPTHFDMCGDDATVVRTWQTTPPLILWSRHNVDGVTFCEAYRADLSSLSTDDMSRSTPRCFDAFVSGPGARWNIAHPDGSKQHEWNTIPVWDCFGPALRAPCSQSWSCQEEAEYIGASQRSIIDSKLHQTFLMRWLVTSSAIRSRSVKTCQSRSQWDARAPVASPPSD